MEEDSKESQATSKDGKSDSNGSGSSSSEELNKETLLHSVAVQPYDIFSEFKEIGFCDCIAFLHKKNIAPEPNDYNYKYSTRYFLPFIKQCKYHCIIQPSLVYNLGKKNKFCKKITNTSTDMVGHSSRVLNKTLQLVIFRYPSSTKRRSFKTGGTLAFP